MTDDQLLRYSRHILLKEVGAIGQARLRQARVLVVGAGGLGSPLALYLAAAGVGTLGIVDSDVVDASNLQRQIIHGQADVGRLKTHSAADSIRAINPLVDVVCHDLQLTSDNVADLFAGYDLILDGAVTSAKLAGGILSGLDSGTMLATARVKLPSGFLWCNGAAVSRATYAALFAAISVAVTGNRTSGSTGIASVSEDLRNLGLVGAKIEGTGIPAGATITAVTSTTITLSANATSGSGTSTALTIIPWGSGDGSTTFNVPDKRGRVGAGRDDMGAAGDAAASRLTSATVVGTILGNAGGSQTHTLLEAELAEYKREFGDAVGEQMFEQEYLCSFEQPVVGAIYAAELRAAREQGRIGRVPYDPLLPVHTWWDIGGAGQGGDATGVWFIQKQRAEVRAIRYHESTGKALPYYAKYCTELPYRYGTHWFPHDARAKSLGSGRSIEELAGGYYDPTTGEQVPGMLPGEVKISPAVNVEEVAAKAAAALVEVDYEPLPVVVDMEDALKDGAPLVHAAFGTNASYTAKMPCGRFWMKMTISTSTMIFASTAPDSPSSSLFSTPSPSAA